MRGVRARSGLVLLVLSSGCSRTTPSKESAASGPLVYVSDEEGGSIAVVDPARAAVVASIPVGKRPRGVKLSRDGRLLYVALSGSPRGGPGIDESQLPPADRAAGLDRSDRKDGAQARAGLPRTVRIESRSISRPDGRTLYVSNQETAKEIIGSRSLLRPDPQQSQRRQVFEGVTVRPDGKVVYVTSEQDAKVTAIDSATRCQSSHRCIQARARNPVAVTADGPIEVRDSDEQRTMVRCSTRRRSKPQAASRSVRTRAPTGPRPMGASLSADGKLLYVSCGRGGSVAVIDVATRKQVRSIDGVGDRPWGIALSRDGTRLYSANGTSHDMSIVSLSTNSVDKRNHVADRLGSRPRALARR